MGGVYDPELAARSVRELAAVTDAELTAGIRAAYAVVLTRAETWRRAAGRSHGYWEQRAYAAVVAGRDALDQLSADAPLIAWQNAVRPVLGQWWPRHPAEAQAAADAVDQLRAAALVRPSQVRDCRVLVRTASGPRTPEPPLDSVESTR